MNLFAATLGNVSAISVIYFPKDGAASPRVSSHDAQLTYTFQPSLLSLKNELENPTTQWDLTNLGWSPLYGFQHNASKSS